MYSFSLNEHHVLIKRCDHVFNSKLNKLELFYIKNFGTLITKAIRHRHVFLFFHLTYLVQLLYLGETVKT